MTYFTCWSYRVFTAFLLLAGYQAMAQDKPVECPPEGYELGVAVGRSQYFGDMHTSEAYASTGFNMNIQGFIRRQISPLLSVRGNLLLGGLAANDRDNPAGRWDYRRAKFTASMIELAAVLEVYPFGRKYAWLGRFGSRLSPYGFAGMGGVLTNPTVRYELDPATWPTTLIAVDKQNSGKPVPVLPIGIGARYNVSSKLDVSAEIGYRVTWSDYLDGFNEQGYGYSTFKDSYLTVNVGFVYRRTSSDSDGDGLADRCDSCPRLFGLAAMGGCPDADNDGVIDPDDSCPDEYGDPATCGCPDDDQDGVPNSCDCCPTEKGDRASHGCPKSHNIEYQHVRLPATMRYCPLCPTDLPNASRRQKTNRLTLSMRKTR